MFSSVGWGEILILLAAGLIILGPERLPGAISWSMQSLRKARDYATGATDHHQWEIDVRMLVGVTDATTVQHQRMVQQVPVAIRCGFQLFEEMRGQTDVILVHLGPLLKLKGVVLVM